MDVAAEIAKVMNAALLEDVGAGDVTGQTTIPDNAVGKYVMRARTEMVFCGVDAIRIGFGAMAEILVNDGAVLKPGDVIANISGNVREILKLERSVLNLVHFLSSIATETAKYVKAVEGTKAKILDTRKTIPGLRMVSKYAVKCGGGVNHRIGLFDMVMIKDNHIRSAGGITVAITKAKTSGVKVEVECDSIEQVKEALNAKPDVIMADNMTLEQLREVVAFVAGRVAIEASGNVNLETVRAIAETGVDYISTSKMTMAPKPVDIGLDEVI